MLNIFGIKLILNKHLNLFQPELVEYYYLWKKTPGANNNRPHRRRRQGSLRRIRTTRATRPSSAQKDEISMFLIVCIKTKINFSNTF